MREKAYRFDLRYSLRRRFVDDFLASQAETWRPGLRVLDLGGTRTNKRGRFDIGRYPVQVTYLNLSTAKRPDVCADAAAIPLKGSTFDVVVCSEVLEHVPDPRPVLVEIYRVLVPGGQVLITCPFMYRVHGDPEDYGRYTGDYWELNLKRAGFSSLNMSPQGGFHAVVVDFCRQYAVTMRGSGWLARILGAGLPAFEWWAIRKADRCNEKGDEFFASFASGWQVVAMRPNKLTDQRVWR